MFHALLRAKTLAVLQVYSPAKVQSRTPEPRGAPPSTQPTYPRRTRGAEPTSRNLAV